MLLTDETVDGERRVYFTRAGSVISYFTEDDGGGVAVTVQHGEFACQWSSTPEKLDAVRDAMLKETARRLNVREDQVQLMTLNDIGNVADPPPQGAPSLDGTRQEPFSGRTLKICSTPEPTRKTSPRPRAGASHKDFITLVIG